jgi:tRNA dimethylallyltransferase
MASRRPEAPVLALVGPTGSGKTEVAITVAERLGAEVVAVDAFTVYRGMDVGTAKPPPEVRARVPHHMMDELDPTEACTVQWFQATARSAIRAVRDRGRVPLLVGGSGLYFRAVVDPLEFPPTDPAVRAALERRWAGDSAGAHAHLARIDPPGAQRIDPANLRRTVRALEVHAISGKPFSAWRRAWDRYESLYKGLRPVGLAPARAELDRRIDARVDAMVRSGLLEECRRLARLNLSVTARQAIGYAEMLDHLAGRLSLDDAVERTRLRTRRYAARQLRWFRSDPRVQWVVPEDAAAALRTLHG